MRSRPRARRSASTRYTPGSSTSCSSAVPSTLGDQVAVPQQAQAAASGVRARSVRRPAGASAPIGQVVGLEGEAPRRSHHVGGDVAAALAQSRVDLVAVVPDLAGGRLGAEHVGADETKRAPVGHHPQGHDRAHADAELVGVEAAERHHPALAAERVPGLHVPLGGMVERVGRAEDEAQQLAHVRARRRRCR